MATKGERQALLFLAAVALLGAATRLYRARQVPAETAGLDQQIEAIDDARDTAAPRRARRRAKEKPATSDPADTTLTEGSAAPAVRVPVDVDVAPRDEIESLPGIGPSLAGRIVADRVTNGPFGCLAALDAVKGVGPALVRRLDSLVTFSGPPRPVCVSGADDRRTLSRQGVEESPRR